MADSPIPVDTAKDLIKQYIVYMKDLGVDMDHQTQSVTFTGSRVTDWIATVMPFADELKVFMGCYPSGNPNAGRTTVILWPYLNGQPALDGSGAEIDPYNDGAGNP